MALKTDLKIWYDLTEASGNAVDAHGGHTGVETSGTIGQDTGPGGASSARAFAATDTEYFEVTDHADVSHSDADYTWQAFVKLASTPGTNMHVVSKWNGSGGQDEIRLFINASSQASFQVSNNGTASTTVAATTFGALSTGVWYHLLAWHDATNDIIGISVNGTANTASHSTGIFDSTTNLVIGARSNAAQYFDGLIARVAKWNRLLTGDEKTELNNSGLGMLYAELDAAGDPATAITQLSPMALPGRRYSFTAKTPASGGFQAAWARGSNVLLQPGVICA